MQIKKKADDTNVKKELPFFASFPLLFPTVYFPWDVEKATYCFLASEAEESAAKNVTHYLKKYFLFVP